MIMRRHSGEEGNRLDQKNHDTERARGPASRDGAEVHIAGAGPAGLAAAITLARAGRAVVVHEARKEVGCRFGGDLQGLENWTTREDVLLALEELGLTTDFNTVPCRQGTVFDPRGRRYEIRSEETLFYLVERGPGPGTLDRALLEQARGLGVEVRFNHRLHRLEGEGILAAGPRAADAIAVGYHFETDMDDGYWVICDDRLAPGGYAYLLVMNGKGTVKSCLFRDFINEREYVQRTVEAFTRYVGLSMRNAVAHGGSGNFRIPQSAYSGRHPLIGEQAGFQDTLWGFGMRLAMTSGVLAARSLIDGEDYDRLWKRALKPQMDVSVVNRVLYGRLGERGYRWFVSWVASRPRLRESLRRQYGPSWMKSLLMPWARRRYVSQRRDTHCHHAECSCVWCRARC